MMVQEPLKDKVTSLEIKQAVTEVTMTDLKEDIENLREETTQGFRDIRIFMQKALVGIIGLLLTIIGYYVKINS